MTFSEHVLQFNEKISHQSFELPNGFKVINPYNGNQKELIQQITWQFYQKYYHDNSSRRLLLGSSPGRRGTAVTGVPFEDANHLQKETGIVVDNFSIHPSSSNFLYDVIYEYGGCKKFYKDFYMNFVCPLGIVKINTKGNEVNCNYYENKKLLKVLYPFIINSLRSIIDFGIDTSVCYCIGSGENYKILSEINTKYNFFDEIVPLEHPRFIMQYHSKDKDFYMNKYLSAFCNYQKDITKKK